MAKSIGDFLTGNFISVDRRPSLHAYITSKPILESVVRTKVRMDARL